jgi:hypothetical protein
MMFSDPVGPGSRPFGFLVRHLRVLRADALLGGFFLVAWSLFLFNILFFLTLLHLRESISNGQRLDDQHDPQPLGFAVRGL